MEESTTLNRLVFLITRYGVRIPKSLQKFLPWGDWLSQLADGPGASEVNLDQVSGLIEAGSALGPGSHEEALILIRNVVDEELQSRSAEMTPDERLSIYTTLRTFSTNGAMLETGEFSMAEDLQGYEQVQKWDSGFSPLDQTFDGLYQGLLVLVGRPGTGKTSLMLTLMEEAIRTGACSSILFVENEIPMQMMKYRVSQMQGRKTKFRKEDRMICASWGAAQILEFVEANPDPDRIVIFDSPDVVVTGGDDRRFHLEEAYQDLIRVKLKSKLVVVSSQPNRKSKIIGLDSLAEAWAKAWYADMVASIGTAGPAKLRFNNLKNRFGPSQRSKTFRYDYMDLTWSMDNRDVDTEDW